MEWMWVLTIVLVTTMEDTKFEEVEFTTQEACIAAAEAFVEEHPAFEWRDPREDPSVMHPVVRSYVQCVPVPTW